MRKEKNTGVVKMYKNSNNYRSDQTNFGSKGRGRGRDRKWKTKFQM